MANTHKRKGFIAKFGSLTGANDVAESLGHMTAAWSFLEHQMSQTLGLLCGIDEEKAVAIMYAQNATSSRLAILQQLVDRLQEGNEQDNWRKIHGAVKALMNRRNSLTHHLWVVNSDTNVAYTFDYRQPPDTQARRVTRTPDGIDKFTAEILDCCHAYAVMLGQITQEEALEPPEGQ